jgi:hypothetical protein
MPITSMKKVNALILTEWTRLCYFFAFIHSTDRRAVQCVVYNFSLRNTCAASAISNILLSAGQTPVYHLSTDKWLSFLSLLAILFSL